MTAILILSYLLYAFNAPLIRLIEGYPFRFEWLGQILSRCQQAKYRHYYSEMHNAQEKIDEIVIQQNRLVSRYNLLSSEDKTNHKDYSRLEQWKKGWQALRNAANQILYYHYLYPAGNEADIVPTLLGNTIASFEKYAYDRYGINAVIMWPRLVPILQDQGFVPFVENEKTVFDFLLNLAFLILLLAIEVCLVTSIYNPLKGGLISIGLGLVAFLLYKASVVGALNWGGTIEVAFDMYRGHLREALRLKEPTSLEQEQNDWRDLSKFYVDGVPFGRFSYTEKSEIETDQV